MRPQTLNYWNEPIPVRTQLEKILKETLQNSPLALKQSRAASREARQLNTGYLHFISFVLKKLT